MANEYTPTVNSTAQLAAAVSSIFAPPNKASLVLFPLCSSVNAAGMSSLVVKIPNPSDMTAASAATYGTALSSNDSLAFGTASSLTITEGAATRGIILDTSVEVQLNRAGMGSIDQLMQEGTLAQKAEILGPEISRLVAAVLEKFEADHAALTTSPSNSVGSTGTALSISTMLSAKYTFATLEPITPNPGYFLWPVQIRDLQNDLGTTGGGLGGEIWSNVDTSFFSSKAFPLNGAAGSFLGDPVYVGSHSLRTLINASADVAGMMFNIGQGDPFVNPLTYGYIANAVRPSQAGTPWKLRMINSPDDRGTKVSVVMEYGVGEFRDTLGVEVISQAT
jgi:hypothetical protein